MKEGSKACVHLNALTLLQIRNKLLSLLVKYTFTSLCTYKHFQNLVSYWLMFQVLAQQNENLKKKSSSKHNLPVLQRSYCKQVPWTRMT